MKREFIKNLLPDIDKDVLDAIMAENGRDIEAKNNAITSLTTERDGLKDQLATANTTIQSYKDMDIEGIKASAGEWESKYNADTQALKDQLAASEYGYAVKEAIGGIKFSSESAKKAFAADLTAKKLPLQDGKLLGLEDFTKGFKESDPDAFIPEDDDRTPIVVRGGGGNITGASAALRAAFGLETRKDS